ncbi:putative reverse transcriptase, RNA-dependent DNA polymerase [Tanacetum coccineum]
MIFVVTKVKDLENGILQNFRTTATLEAYDGKINLGVEENMISNEYAVKLSLEHEVKKGNKVVKKELTSLDDWDHLLDFNLDDIPLLGGEELSPFVCKMGKSSRNKKRSMENLSLIYQDIRISSSAGGHLTQEEAAKEALAIRISQKFALLAEVRLVIETMAYNDKYKKILDEIWKEKVELDGKIIKEDEEAVKRIKGEALKEKDDPGAFIFPIRLEGQVNKNALADTGPDINTMPYRIYERLGREEMKKVDRGITMINHTQAEAMGILINVLCQVRVTTLIAKFLILDIPIDRDAPIVVGRGFLHTIGGIVNIIERLFSTFDGFCHQTFRAARSNVMRNAETERSLAIQTVTNPFQKISVWKKVVSFLGSLPVPLKHVNWKPDYKGSYTKEEEATGQWRTEIRLTDPYGNICLQRLWEHTMMRSDHQDPNALDNMKPWKRMGCDGEIDDMLRIRLREAESNEEIFTFVVWIRAFNINEPIYAELCNEFYSTYEFDKVCADDELKTKKIIKFRLGGRAHNLTLLEFAHKLGLYHADELEENGFNVYFEGGLRSDERFNAQKYWLSISREENLGLSRSHTSTIRSLILRVIHKMITYGLCQRTTGYDKIQKNDLWLLSMFDARHQNGYANVAWLIARWMKRKGAGTQKESQICCGQFISKIARKSRVLTDDVVRSLSAPIYCRDLDTTPLRDLIDSEGRLIPEDPQPGVPRVGIPRPPRASMQGVFEHMAGVYSVPLQGAYNLPSYAQS